MHIRRPPSFFFAKRIGAPYAPLAISIRPESKNVRIYVFSSSSSTPSKGYNFLLGGGAFSSLSGMECWKIWGHSDLSTGYFGSLNTYLYFIFNFYNYYYAVSSSTPESASASSPPPKVARCVKFRHSSEFPQSYYNSPTCVYSKRFLRLLKTL
jgi:hypothetical protein